MHLWHQKRTNLLQTDLNKQMGSPRTCSFVHLKYCLPISKSYWEFRISYYISCHIPNGSLQFSSREYRGNLSHVLYQKSQKQHYLSSHPFKFLSLGHCAWQAWRMEKYSYTEGNYPGYSTWCGCQEASIKRERKEADRVHCREWTLYHVVVNEKCLKALKGSSSEIMALQTIKGTCINQFGASILH